jgi:hypothetical protein
MIEAYSFLVTVPFFRCLLEELVPNVDNSQSSSWWQMWLKGKFPQKSATYAWKNRSNSLKTIIRCFAQESCFKRPQFTLHQSLSKS